MADIKYDIIKEIGVLSKNAKGWQKELNLISWNGGAAKYDIRDWAPDHEKMGKGTTLTEEEIENLKEMQYPDTGTRSGYHKRRGRGGMAYHLHNRRLPRRIYQVFKGSFPGTKGNDQGRLCDYMRGFWVLG